MRLDGDPRWTHDEDCSLAIPCRVCEEETRSQQETAMIFSEKPMPEPEPVPAPEPEKEEAP